MANCFNPTCRCKDLQIVREIILRCDNCNCAVKVESTKLELPTAFGVEWNSEDCERLLFTVTKNAK